MANSLKNPKYYINRELSWVRFNERVLEEAMEKEQPLLERLKFLSIFSSNLDEFFMIRVAGLKDQIHAGIHEVPADGMSPLEQISRISEDVHRLVDLQSKTLLEEVIPQLRQEGVRFRHFNSLGKKQKDLFRRYFKDKIFPILTPLAIDPAHPFPQLRNLGLNLLVELKEPYVRNDRKIAVVPVPQLVDRLIRVPEANSDDYILMEDLIQENLGILFPEMRILDSSLFRITRNADLDLSEAEADDLLQHIERQLRKRRLGTVNRLEVSEKMNLEQKKYLKLMTHLEDKDIYDITGYIDLAPFISLYSLERPDLKDSEFTPALREEIVRHENIFEAIRAGDILLHHPYDSFNHVIEMIQEAAKDPDVLAIKQTLYRTSGKSPIVQALQDAVEKGKQVTALVELKARFDEETNIVWAREMERAGVNVVYGLMGLKTHCKICMIVRQEGDKIVRYVHVGTGNYNVKTARMYTDFGLLTCDPDIGKDASELFNFLTGYSKQKSWRKLIVAPANMRSSLISEIRNVIRFHSKEQPGSIRMIMNSLVDPEIIQWLYKASMKGIKCDLIVRGICCLIPQINDVSSNITVKSIVGRFLEHSRVYIFEYSGKQKIYLGSADLMQRNLNRRVELLFPLESVSLKERLVEIVNATFSDNLNSRMLQPSGSYLRVKPGSGEKATDIHTHLLKMAQERRLLIDTIQQ